MMDNLFRIICYLLQIPDKGTPFITEKQKKSARNFNKWNLFRNFASQMNSLHRQT